MTAHRKMLMEDYNISPELVNACNEDIENNCKVLGKKGNNPGEVIHCLMRAVMEQKVTDQKVNKNTFSFQKILLGFHSRLIMAPMKQLAWLTWRWSVSRLR